MEKYFYITYTCSCILSQTISEACDTNFTSVNKLCNVYVFAYSKNSDLL